MTSWLRIGDVVERTGLTHRTLRHYDELGLLSPSGRSSGDYRLYSEDDLRRLLATGVGVGVGDGVDGGAVVTDGFGETEAGPRSTFAHPANSASQAALASNCRRLICTVIVSRWWV